MARVFSAVDIEDPALLDDLEGVRDRFDLGFNPVDREKMHVTLQFFEDVDENDIEEVKNAMDAVALAPFSAEVKGVGAFPSNDYIRVIWAGIENGRFHRLYEEVSDHGVESSNGYEFKPHVTLMRVKDLSPDKKRKLQRSIRDFENHLFGTLKVNSVKLYESRLTGKGSEYDLLHEVEL